MQRSKSVKSKAGHAASATKRARAKAPRKTGSKPASELVFRPRRPEDDEYIVQLTEEQLGAVHAQAFQEPFPRDQFLRYLQSGAPTVLVERGGKRIGYYSYLIGPDAKMHIGAMVIERNHQSNGIGTAVMKQLEKEAAERGVQILEVFVQANNERSLAFTRKLGFTEVFRIHPNTICFQKRIGGTPVQQAPQVGAPSTEWPGQVPSGTAPVPPVQQPASAPGAVDPYAFW
ncbi:MAG: GNAT family N-acetyltransferase [Alicyclobacillus sp.]|nr:GNAT family N-acetyltransferase [Alicyclobacillus sp.]